MKVANYTYVFNRRNKKIGKDKKATIELRITYFGVTYISSGLQVKQCEWDSKKKQVSKKHPNFNRINTLLQKQIIEVTEYELDLRSKRKNVSKTILSDFIKNKSKESNKPNLIQWCWSILDSGLQENIKKRKAVLRKLALFNPNLEFEDINYVFMLDFHKFLAEQIIPTTGKPYRSSTIYTNFGTLRSFLTLAQKSGLIREVPTYRPKYDITPKPALNESELTKIKEIKYGEDAVSIKMVRDSFIFTCYTGLRYIDLAKLSEANIEDTAKGIFITLIQTKTTNAVRLPLRKLFDGEPEKILIKYRSKNQGKETIFETFSNSQMNLYLRQISLHANIYKHLSWHVGRHTCLTLLGKKTGNPYLVKLIAGHRKIESSMAYTQHVMDDMLFELL